MPKRTSIPSRSSRSGQEIYDEIMAAIEPELLSAELPHLAERNANESGESRLHRRERYRRAFREYDAAYQRRMFEAEQRARDRRKNCRRKTERAAWQEDAEALARMESIFLS